MSKQKIEVDCLSTATNGAVVQMPGRRFPGVVVQGDTLFALHEDALEAATVAAEGGDHELAAVTRSIADRLAQLLSEYEQVMSAENRALPYSKS